MRIIFKHILFALLFSFINLSIETSNAQTVQVALGADTTLPCGVSCLNLKANFTQAYGTNSYLLDSSISYSNHYAYIGGSSTSIPTVDDYFGGVISLPFNFCFYNVTYPSLVIGTNGIISFNTGNAGNFCSYSVPGAIPAYTYHPPSIMPAFHDINPAIGGSINYYTAGVAPNRKFIINYSAVPHWGCNNKSSTFQCVLYETSNIIEFYIQDKPVCTSDLSNGKAISGIQKNGTTALALPGKNGTVWGSVGMNKAYRFTPNTTTSLPTAQLLNSSGTIIATATPTASTTPGVLTATFNNICLTNDSANFIARIIYPCNNAIIYDTVKVKRLIVLPPVVTTPVTYCQGATATPLIAAGQNLLWYPTASGGTGSSTAPTPNTSTIGTQVYYVSQTASNCESTRDSIIVNIIGTPLPTAGNNGPLCEGTTLNLNVNAVAGATYSWTGPNGFSSLSQTPFINNVQTIDAGIYSVTTTANGCTSAVANTTVTVNALPVINNTTFTNPTTCGGNDGTITLNGLTNGAIYIVNYSKNGQPQAALSLSATSGAVMIIGLTAGSYSNISITKNGCISLPAATIILTDPNAPAIPVVSSNSPICEGTTLNIFTAALAGAIYSWTGPNNFASSSQTPSIANAQPINSGTYAVTVTVNNCTSGAGTTNVIVNPLPIITSVSGVNPTTCLGADGSISINGLMANTSYTINYSKNNIAQPSLILGANNFGIATIPNLTAGSYSNIVVTLASCTSAVAGPVILLDPLPPSAPTASSNSPLCEGTTLNLTASTVSSAVYNWTGPNSFTSPSQTPFINNVTVAATGLYTVTATVNNCTSLAGLVNVVVNQIPTTPTATSNSPVCAGSQLNLFTTNITNATYNWTGPNNFTSSLQNPSIATATIAATGNYTVTATVNNCTSADGIVTVIVNPIPIITALTFINPTTCNGSNGSITITGVNNTTTYSISYSKNNVAQTPVSILSGINGTVTISNLIAGIYSNIIITLNGCSSALAGIITLSDPPAPAAPTITNNGPLCAGTTLNLSASTIAGAIYNWAGPSFSSSLQNPTITNAQAINSGIYSVTATLNNCISQTASTSVVINPIPIINSTSFINPTTCGGSDGSITLSGLLANTSYTVSYINGSSTTITATSNALGSIILSGLSAGTYASINVMLTGCISASQSAITLSNPTPPATPTVSGNSPVCENGTINLSASTIANALYSWSGPNSYSATQQNPVIANAQPINAGIYSVTVTVNNCVSSPATINVIVNPTPNIASSSFVNPTGCNGINGSITLNGLNHLTGYIVNYSKNNVPQTPAALTSNSSGIITISNLSAGTYSDIQVVLNGCTSNIVGPLILSDPGNPTPPVISNNGPLCSGATLNLTASAIPGAIYSWTGPGFTSALQNPSIANVQAANAGVYSVTVTLNNCTSNPSTTNVVITQTPSIPIVGSNSPLCEGNDLNLTATTTPGASYSWTGPNNFYSSLQNPVIINTTTNTTGIYTIVAVLNGCTSSASTTVVNVNPLPASPVTNDVTYCQSAPTLPLTATGQNLLWYNVSVGGVGNINTPTPSTALAGTFTWYVSQTVNGCESQRSAITVIVTAKPSLPVITSPVTYCQGEIATALNATGQNILWYATQTGGNGSNLTPIPSTANSGVFNWYVTQSIAGCESDRAAVNVIINARPPAPAVSSPIFYCEGEAASTLTAQGQNLLWYNTAIGGQGFITPPTPSTSNIGAVNYYVSQAINGCESNRAVITVTINQKAKASITADKNIVCQNDTITINNIGNNSSGALSNWNFDGGNIISGSGSGPYKIKWLSNGIKTIHLTVNNSNCSVSDSIQVMVQPAPSSSFVLKHDGCIGEIFTVQAAWNSLANSTYNWSFNNANILSGSGAGAYKLQWETSGEKIISLTATGGGCMSFFSDTLVIHENPIAKIKPIPQENICTGDEVILNAEDNNPNGSYNYLWLPQKFFSLNGTQTVMAKVSNTGFVSLQLTDAYGCNGFDSILINTKPCCDVFLPDAFSPNGDGRNDKFHVVTAGNHQISLFMIMNRWGQTVFKTSNEKEGWDGTFAGKAQDMGTYFYYLKYHCDNDQTIEKKGEVTLIR